MRKLWALLLALALLVCAMPVLAEETADESVTVTIFHTNDVHGRYDSSAGMGYAMMASYVNAARDAGENVLVLDAGDTLHGTVYANYTKGSSIIELMNAIGYTAMAPGNHDFNYGFQRLTELVAEANFPILSANILLEDGSHAFETHAIVEIAGKKIAIVGAQTPEMVSSIHPDAVKGLTFASVEEVEKVVQEVRREADAVIVLAHWGATESYEHNSIEALASIDGVTLVIDGHSHTVLYDIKQSENEEDALVVSTGEYLNNLGKVTLTFTPDLLQVTAQLIGDPGVYEDHGMINIIEAAETVQDAILDEAIGSTTVELVGEREIVRAQESNWGNLACDIFLDATGADCAIVNGGGVRATVPAGDITNRNVNTVFPFSNSVVVIEATGQQILDGLEAGFSKYPELNGGFPQVGGIKVTFDPSKEAGSRITELFIGGVAVDPAATYSVATNDYLAAGGDGYPFADCTVLLSMGYMDEIVVQYLKENSPVSPAVEGRIVIVE